MSRVLDGIKIASAGINVTNGTAVFGDGTTLNVLPLDMRHSAVTGCSYASKMALFSGALDERIALTIAQENGGGVPSWRISRALEAPGSVEDIDDTDYDWFGDQMKQFAANNVYKIPDDHDELAAMVAPRALLETGNTDFYWLSNHSNYVSARAAQKIYSTLGIPDRFGFYIDGGHAHCAVLPAEVPVIQSYVDKFLLGQNVDTNVAVYPQTPDFTNLNYQQWTAWWGTNNPLFPTNTILNSGGDVVFASDVNLNINGGDTVTAGYSLQMPGNHAAATITMPGGNVQVDISCPDGSSSTLTIPIPSGTYSIPANDNYWAPTDDPNSPLVYQGSATANSCAGSKATKAYFTAVGVSPGAGNAGGPGFQTNDTTDPLVVRFHVSDNGAASTWSKNLTVNFQ